MITRHLTDSVNLLFVARSATADYDIVVDSKVEVIDVLVLKQGGAGGAANTVQVKSTAATISEAISINIAQDAVARNAVRTQANALIPAGGKLRASVIKAGGNAAVEVIVRCLKRP